MLGTVALVAGDQAAAGATRAPGGMSRGGYEAKVLACRVPGL